MSRRKYKQNVRKAMNTTKSSGNKSGTSSNWGRSCLAKLFLVSAICVFLGVYGALTIHDKKENQPSVQGLYGPVDRTWTADSIPMPHLTDGNRYVSNPDGILSDSIVFCIDNIMRRMDAELGIESAVIVVNHVEGRNIFRFAQDVFNRYGVGKDDRGLVLVLAYGDHLVRTHTGRSLEADLTDAECRHLQDDNLIPYVKENRPNAGMLRWTSALYEYMKGKQANGKAKELKDELAERKQMVKNQFANIDESSAKPFIQATQQADDDDENIFLSLGMVVLIILIMLIYYWINGDLFTGGGSGGYSSDSSDSSYRSYSSSSSSGGYSGGSSGGGGATSSW
ncbi:MAG: TPM domain-containing protein [Prevotella sp.]|nr:TPM domain-containing protein [Prevotella sp.]